MMYSSLIYALVANIGILHIHTWHIHTWQHGAHAPRRFDVYIDVKFDVPVNAPSDVVSASFMASYSDVFAWGRIHFA
jgi:hypothetical protein